MHLKFAKPYDRGETYTCTKNKVTFTEEIVNGKLHFLCSVIEMVENGNKLKILVWKAGKSLKNEIKNLFFLLSFIINGILYITAVMGIIESATT